MFGAGDGDISPLREEDSGVEIAAPPQSNNFMVLDDDTTNILDD